MFMYPMPCIFQPEIQQLVEGSAASSKEISAVAETRLNIFNFDVSKLYASLSQCMHTDIPIMQLYA